MMVRTGAILALVLTSAIALAQEPVPVGEEFQINTYTTSYQLVPSLALDAAGNFVVVWGSDGSHETDTSSYSVQGQRYDAAGNTVGNEFQVNSYTSGSQRRPSVGTDADGNFVVVWGSEGSFVTDSDGWSIQGQRYDAAGNPVGNQFQVNTYTTGYQTLASVAVDAEGDFVVVWGSEGSYGSDTSLRSVQGQRYDAVGNAVGGEFQVNTYTTGVQNWPSVAVDADGDFVVVWSSEGSYGSDTSSYSVQGQRYDAAGNAVGGEFQVNTYTTSYVFKPIAAFDADGGFVVVWASDGSYGTDVSGTSVQGQRYDTVGNPIGGQFQVNAYTTSNQSFASTAFDFSGNFVVVWASDGSSDTDASYQSVQGQRYDAAGNGVGGEFQVNTYTTGVQNWPSVGFNAHGDFVAVWHGNGSAGTDNDWSIQGQRFALPIFADGFESGDTSAWSSTSP